MKFPDPEHSNPYGLLAMGGELTTEVLESAYTQGIFPWPQRGMPLLWFSPPERGVLFLDKFKTPRSSQKKIRQKVFDLTVNENFKGVIENCSQVPRTHESDTWILPEMVTAYTQLHDEGKALSVEAWQDDELVGGIYGVLFQGVFSGESMFHKKSEASKVCLVHLVEILQKQGHQWIDIQMVTPLLAKLGGEYIPRKSYLAMLRQRQKSFKSES